MASMNIIINSATGIASHIPSVPIIVGRMVRKSSVNIKTLRNDIVADLFPSPIDVNIVDVIIDIPHIKKLNENNLSPREAISYTELSGLQNKPVTRFDPKKDMTNIIIENINTNLKQSLINFSVYSYFLAPHA